MSALDEVNFLGITSQEYQNRALRCVSDFLALFLASPKTQSKKIRNNETIPVSLRVHENPPSVQILKLPKGGSRAGELRICEKLAAESTTAKSFLIAHEEDLTHECIIMTLNDAAIDKILKSGLISPPCVAQTLNAICRDHPNFFIVMQRYIMGIEKKSGLSVPYTVVEESDEKTMEYLEHLPEQLL